MWQVLLDNFQIRPTQLSGATALPFERRSSKDSDSECAFPGLGRECHCSGVLLQESLSSLYIMLFFSLICAFVGPSKLFFHSLEISTPNLKTYLPWMIYCVASVS